MKNKLKTGLLNIGLKFISIDEKIFRMIMETSPSNVNEIVILPAVKVVMEKIVKMLENKKRYGQIYNGKLNNINVSVIQSLVGCPYISEKMECLKFTKCKTVIRVDFCGGLSIPGITLEPGMIFLPNLALCGDGTSPHYILTHNKVLKDLDFLENPITGFKEIKAGSERIYKTYPSKKVYDILLNNAEKLYPGKILKGTVWTTDALFCETDEIVDSWINANILGVDMENSLLFLLGKLFNINTASVNSISDIPGHPKYDLFKSNTIHPDTFLGIDRAMNIVIRSLQQIQNIP